MTIMKRAVVLLSGGIDSATTMAVARSTGYRIFALSFYYGQRHSIELDKAKLLADTMGVQKHLIIEINLRAIGGSALTDDIQVPKDRAFFEISSAIPVTYVPARNTIFLSYALAWGEVLRAFDIFLGVNAVDFSGYPDCRPEYIEAFERMANLAVKATVEKQGRIHIHTPLIHLTKADIIKKGIVLGVDYSMTHSCYEPSTDGKACGRCDSCLLRIKGFKEASLQDSIPYIRQ
jgi:7-cyano-7-deazaguanine synthase